ncbi:hypothetical protein DDZ18_06195 [Marinicauda salina]|uniref:Uncharacterized protein n=2 Tax=Marinicauda salina TaxID=2135793 RepID=A0A2U2BTF0_9PROT|nr:hypothetical protein DDZ18_06195 [Marinicauda salina]
MILDRLGVMDEADALASLGVFRSFSNRIEMLDELRKRRDPQTIEHACLSYYKGLLTEANSIRNKYAHAKYGIAKDHFVLYTFSGDHNRQPVRIAQTIDDFASDKNRLKRIICELHAFCARGAISSGLDKQLSQLSP